LRADNPDYPDIAIQNGQELQIWGVVAHVVHKV
jgi:SOS-response transcriptional repressor LexA